MSREHSAYIKFHGKSQMDKSINTLIGLVEGISIDRQINPAEMQFFKRWLDEHDEVRDRHPYNELMPVIAHAVCTGHFTEEESADVTWLCERMCSTDYCDRITADLQRLHALVAGIMADGAVTDSELGGLSTWLEEHEHLASCWPYDEIYSLVLGVRQDGVIDAREQTLLRSFFSEFFALCDDKTITNPLVEVSGSFVGLCAVAPNIRFFDGVFCFTGASSLYLRKDLQETIERLGGKFSTSVSKKVHYLIIGAEGNPCWAYSCYGRKVEKAVELRKAGVRLMIVHENDFHDAVQDAG